MTTNRKEQELNVSQLQRFFDDVMNAHQQLESGIAHDEGQARLQEYSSLLGTELVWLRGEVEKAVGATEELSDLKSDVESLEQEKSELQDRIDQLEQQLHEIEEDV